MFVKKAVKRFLHAGAVLPVVGGIVGLLFWLGLWFPVNFVTQSQPTGMSELGFIIGFHGLLLIPGVLSTVVYYVITGGKYPSTFSLLLSKDKSPNGGGNIS